MTATAQTRYDVVLFGATGFTGALTAGYLASMRHPGSRWALAGRNGPSWRRSAPSSD
jgi:short subunit dehydrogenase-like uncharacterized protein